MIYIGNIEILTAKSAIYLGNVGYDDIPMFKARRDSLKAALAG
jgi:hypothetical protein